MNSFRVYRPVEVAFWSEVEDLQEKLSKYDREFRKADAKKAGASILTSSEIFEVRRQESNIGDMGIDDFRQWTEENLPESSNSSLLCWVSGSNRTDSTRSSPRQTWVGYRLHSNTVIGERVQVLKTLSQLNGKRVKLDPRRGAGRVHITVGKIDTNRADDVMSYLRTLELPEVVTILPIVVEPYNKKLL